MSTLEKIVKALLLTLVVCLPFEFRTFPLMSNLQWLFLILAVVSAPLVVRNRRTLLRDRFVIAALVFVLTQWLAAALAGEYLANSLKAAVRVSAGLFLFSVVACQDETKTILKAWCLSAIVAAAYGIADFAGLGAQGLFREAEFYFGDQMRLSGSFEYPTTAGAFYAMSLPVVLMAPLPTPIRAAGSLLLWTALILTYSRGAAVAAALVLLVGVGIRNRRLALKMATVSVAVYALMAMFYPLLLKRFENATSGAPVGAAYQVAFNTIHQKPQTPDQLQVTITNTGAEAWPAAGENSVSLSYHWYDTVNRRILKEPPTETVLPTDVRPNETVRLNASFRTPDAPGLYLLDLDLKRRNQGWFSTNHKVVAAVVEAHIDEGAVPWKGNGDVSLWYRGISGYEPQLLDATVSRTDLWKSAAALASRSPIFGVGPDNFRLLYGRQLGFERWDSHVRSNSLYLELLVGSGLVGLASFIVMLGFLRWNPGAASLGVAVFLLHGFVDVMLMTTPIYFGFWILMGLAHENRT